MKGPRVNVTIEEQREQEKGNQSGWIEFCAPPPGKMLDMV